MTTSSNPGAATPPVVPSAVCAACNSPLSAGARFCHRCGTPVGQGLPLVKNQGGNAASVLPWAVAFVALLALVAVFAGQNFGKPRGSGIDGSANALPTTPIDGPVQGARAPDISNMSPSERANILYQRIMSYAEAGHVDSVAFFAPMAIGAHEMLESPSLDERYHLGRIAEVIGNDTVAIAQADTILAAKPTSLLGLLLASSAALMRNDNATAAKFQQRFMAALPSELATGDQDYELHRREIDRAANAARQR